MIVHPLFHLVLSILTGIFSSYHIVLYQIHSHLSTPSPSSCIINSLVVLCLARAGSRTDVRPVTVIGFYRQSCLSIVGCLLLLLSILNVSFSYPLSPSPALQRYLNGIHHRHSFMCHSTSHATPFLSDYPSGSITALSQPHVFDK